MPPSYDAGGSRSSLYYARLSNGLVEVPLQDRYQRKSGTSKKKHDAPDMADDDEV